MTPSTELISLPSIQEPQQANVLEDYVGLCARRWRLITLCAVGAAVGAALWSLMLKPTYQAPRGTPSSRAARESVTHGVIASPRARRAVRHGDGAFRHGFLATPSSICIVVSGCRMIPMNCPIPSSGQPSAVR